MSQFYLTTPVNRRNSIGELTQLIEEGRKYKFHNINLKSFVRKKSSTTPTTTAITSDEIEETPILSEDVIAELVGTNLTADAACTNDKCGKPVATVPGERIVICLNCNNTMRVNKSSVVCYYLKIFRYYYSQM